MVLVFAGLAATAAIGMSQKSSALSIMGQGSCFILPVIAVLWIRIRKETKARSRKKFKHRSQKLLRAWTAQDIETHAIQWKLRLRPRTKSAVRRWRGFSTRNSSTPNPGHGDEENNQDINRDRLNNTTADNSSNLSPNYPRLHGQASPQNSQEEHEHEQEQEQHQTSESASQSNPTSVQITAPPRVADVYSALRNPAGTTAITTTLTAATAQPTVTTATTAITDEGDPEATPPRSKWEPWKELIMELYCCAYFFKQKKVWMIEISLRENLLDEYALPVPSPVYCDYRLPGYDDVMSGNVTPSNTIVQSVTSTTASTIVAVTARQGTIPVTRYLGLPPAYESDSDDSDDEDGQDDDDEGDSEAESVHIPTSAPVTRGPEMSSSGTPSVVGSIVHRPMEMTTIVVVPSKEEGSENEDRVRVEVHDEVMRSMTSMTTLCASATTSRATLPVAPLAVDGTDKEERQSKEQSDP
ncbi:hypothetical protein BGZ93_000941 [Podila epicladia]|nr:hypothetical protein BGZ92_005413 [Podila epicladia]KAG0098166.1 hypothetical protein BGZ93_000941 [Podila epicladia]